MTDTAQISADGKQVTSDTVAHLVAWLAKQLTASQAKGFVVGLSGGLDSAVTAALCKQACPNATLGVILPIGSNPVDAADAELTAKHLHLPVRKIDLTGIFELFLRELSSWGSHNPQQQMALANLKPRLRMTSLYFIANEYNYLVAGTGNRSELELGYFTKYGDGGADLLPIGALTKTQVRQLARLLNIPKKIIDRVPSADLWEGQNDESELGLTYAEIDTYLLEGTASPVTALAVDEKRKATAHKRQMPPIGEFR